MKPDVTVVIVSYNTRDLLVRCLDTLSVSDPDLHLEIVVVDNASTDGSAAAVRAYSPSVRLMALPRNVGFAAASNQGAAAGSGRHILLLNPDVEVRPGCVAALVASLEAHVATQIVGGRTVRPDGELDPHSCWALPSLWSMFCFATCLSTAFSSSRLFDPESLGSWPRDTDREVGVVTGCLLLCTREFWIKLGGLDETYFVYGEDVDFAFRARRFGAQSRITPKAVIVHVNGASSSPERKWNMIMRGKVTFLRKNWGPVRAQLGIALLVAGTYLRARLARAGVGSASPWPGVWAQRHDWSRGWDSAARAGITS